MPFEILIQKYGYLALFIGTFLEGETILVIGGFAAHRGYLSLPYVIFTAFLGTLLGDQLFFFMGRFKGQRLLEKRPRWQSRIHKAQKLLERYQTLVIIGFRFIYGIRIVTPFVLGMSKVDSRRFIILNIISALCWATTVGTTGYFFGLVVQNLIQDVKQYERLIILGISIIGAVLWLIHFWSRRKFDYLRK